MNEIDGRCMKLHHPFCMMVAGPTMSGKTQWVSQLIFFKQDMIEPPPERIVFSYKSWQPLYDILAQRHDVQFIKGTDIPVTKSPTLVIIDDQMSDISDSTVDLFTRGCHHDNLSLVFITQNLFFQDKKFRTASLNCHYLVLFRNPRDNNQIRHLARQMYPGKRSQTMIEAFEDATTCTPYGTLVVDLKPSTPDLLRLRSNILPPEGLEVGGGSGLTHCYLI